MQVLMKGSLCSACLGVEVELHCEAGGATRVPDTPCLRIQLLSSQDGRVNHYKLAIYTKRKGLI